MVTTKPFATVSYNTEAFLLDLLKSLTSSHKIEFWAFVHHMPEDDEGGRKEHIHLYIEPSKRIDTAVLRDEFKELDVTRPQDPLSCLPFRSSKFQDWYMYACHDREYLAQKAEKRRYHYKREDFKVSDEDAFNYLIKTIDLSELSPVRRLKQFRDSGMTFNQAVSQGLVPLPQLSNYKKVWDILSQPASQDYTDRGGRSNHEQDQDQDQDQGRLPDHQEQDQDQDEEVRRLYRQFNHFEDQGVCSNCGEVFPMDQLEDISEDDDPNTPKYFLCRRCSKYLFANTV